MKSNRSGQAVIEYIMIFAFMGLIGVGFVRGVGGIVDEGMGGLSYELSQQLTTGVCPSRCFGAPGEYTN